MSQAALIKAVRDRLQLLFGLDADSCEIGINGKPKPSAGELYIAVHPNGWRPGPAGGELGQDEYIGCKVTITRRVGNIPKDRWGPEVWGKEDEGIEAMARKVVQEIAGNPDDQDSQTRYLVLIKANEYIGLRDPDTGELVGYAGGFVEPLNFADGGNPEEKGPEWFSSPPVLGEEGEQYEAGIAQTITFRDARRMQGMWQGT